MEEIYSQIVQDLKDAITYLPEEITGSGWSATSIYKCGRANKYVAQSLLAKIWFVMGEYAESEKLLGDVIGSGPFSLEEVYKPFISNGRSGNDEIPVDPSRGTGPD